MEIQVMNAALSFFCALGVVFLLFLLVIGIFVAAYLTEHNRPGGHYDR